MKKVSVIVPVYNAKETLEKCINSILNQTYTNLEIILIDDGSTDKSGVICDEYQKKDARIKVLHKKNSGVSEARNDGIKLSTGDYIQFVDCDDYINNKMTEKLLQVSEANSVDITICGYDIINGESQIPSKDGIYTKDNMLETILDKKGYIYANQPWNRLIKSEIIKKNNIVFDRNMSKGEDYIFNLEVFDKCNKYLIISDCLYNYNQGINGLCRRKRTIDFYWNNNNILWNKLKELYEKNNAYEKYKIKLNSAYIETIKENVNVLIREYANESKKDKINIIKQSFNDARINNVISIYEKNFK